MSDAKDLAAKLREDVSLAEPKDGLVYLLHGEALRIAAELERLAQLEAAGSLVATENAVWFPASTAPPNLPTGVVR